MTLVYGKKATRPCPCGMAGAARQACHCSTEQIQRYLHRISGPLLDRIDIHVEVLKPDVPVLDLGKAGGEPSADVKMRVVAARRIQVERHGMANASLDVSGIREHCALGSKQQELLEDAACKLDFSPRACHRVLKLSRTIADLDQSSGIGLPHVAEAIALRRPALGATRSVPV